MNNESLVYLVLLFKTRLGVFLFAEFGESDPYVCDCYCRFSTSNKFIKGIMNECILGLMKQ